jgi:hypothetical protein
VDLLVLDEGAGIPPWGPISFISRAASGTAVTINAAAAPRILSLNPLLMDDSSNSLSQDNRRLPPESPGITNYKITVFYNIVYRKSNGKMKIVKINRVFCRASAFIFFIIKITLKKEEKTRFCTETYSTANRRFDEPSVRLDLAVKKFYGSSLAHITGWLDKFADFMRIYGIWS